MLNAQPVVNFLNIAYDIFHEQPNVGIIHLRAVMDPYENWGRGKVEFSPWSCPLKQLAEAEIKLWKEKTVAGHEYSISEYPHGWNHNPIIARKSLLEECGPLSEPPLDSDLRHDESHYQKKVANTGCAIAHISLELYYHIGGALAPQYLS